MDSLSDSRAAVPTGPMKAVTDEALSWPDRARQLVISSDAEYARAAVELRRIKVLRNRITEEFGPVVEAAHAAHKTSVAFRKHADDPLNEAEQILKAAMGTFWSSQFSRAQEEDLRREKEAARLAKVQGLEPPVVAPTPVVGIEVPGISYQEHWTATVTDKDAFLKAVSKDAALHGCVNVNQGELSRLARSFRGGLSIPGVTVATTNRVVVR